MVTFPCRELGLADTGIVNREESTIYSLRAKFSERIGVSYGMESDWSLYSLAGTAGFVGAGLLPVAVKSVTDSAGSLPEDKHE